MLNPPSAIDRRGLQPLANFDGSRATAYPRGNKPAPEPVSLLASEGFDDGSLGVVEPFGGPYVAAVTNDPFSGSHCMRGNLAGSFPSNDPITGLGRAGNNTASWPINLVYPDRRNLDIAFVRWRVRFDDANNLDDQGGVSKPKLAYLSDKSQTFETGSSIWPVLQPGVGIRSWYKNGINEEDPAPDWGQTAVFGSCENCGFEYDGQWNTFEILFNYTNSTVELWCNGVKFLGSSKYTDGILPIAGFFRLDAVRFFHANVSVFSNSTNGTGEKGGWQVDALELYDGDPR